MTPKTVLPLFFAVGIVFAPIGGLLLYASSQVSLHEPTRPPRRRRTPYLPFDVTDPDPHGDTQVQEIVLDYSDCIATASETLSDIPAGKVQSHFKPSSTCSEADANAPQWKKSSTTVTYAPGVDVPTDVCTLEFNILDDMSPPVLLYYRLSNFYQNHRRYVKSLDSNQLKGTYVNNGSIDSGSCDPLKLNGTKGFAYYPCGLIANSVFNDTIGNPLLLSVPGSNDANSTFTMTDKGIAWDSDKALYGTSPYKWFEVAPPPDWMKRYPDGYTADNPPPNLHDNEAFQVWMRTAGLPTFSKLALRNDGSTMRCGRWRLEIQDSRSPDRSWSWYGATDARQTFPRTSTVERNRLSSRLERSSEVEIRS